MSEQNPSPNEKTTGRMLPVLAVVAVLFGMGTAVFWFAKAQVEGLFELSPAPAVAGALLAVAGLSIGVYALGEQGGGTAGTAGWRRFRWLRAAAGYGRILSISLAVLLMGAVLWRLPQMGADENYAPWFWLWLGATGFYLLAFARKPAVGWLEAGWWSQHRQIILIAAGLGGLAFGLRVWRVGRIPFALGGDEASQGLEAVRVLNGLLRNPFTTGWLGVPTMSFFFNSWSIDLWGQTIFALRLPWVLVGSATVVLVFFLVKRLAGLKLGVLTAVFLAVYHYHVHFSRLGSNQVADPFFMALALLFLYRALDKKSDLDWALTGVVTAAALYFYAGARLTPVVIIVVLGYLFVLQPRRFWGENGRGILIMTGGFLLVGSPMIQYAIRFPDDFNARLHQVGIFQSGWLASEMALQKTGALPVLWDQFKRSALFFNYYHDRTVWYGLREPMLTPFWGVMFLVGMGYGMLHLFGRWANPRCAPMVAWWWGGMLLGGVLTESPPSSQRLVTLAVPVAFFLALALWQLVRLLLGLVGGGRVNGRLANGLLALGVLLFALGSVKTYFIEFTPQRIYGGPNAEFATQIAPRLQELQYGNSFYFLGAPWMYWGFSTFPYLLPEARAIDVVEPIGEPIAQNFKVEPGKGLVIIIHPQREPELALVEAAFPDGVREMVYSPVDGRLMGWLYVVPPE